ncbi:hypothetical protein HMPREF3293_01977 [Christensenella minuta]|uniref:Uncharacterized protein n=1 Tax=Christensenella minuta TaxID=626937 RepID=A0A136Q234_9FIRM|nr:hypothetical protein HMPREF3293_01977 [Christensenella minuta]
MAVFSILWERRRFYQAGSVGKVQKVLTGSWRILWRKEACAV